MPRLPKKLDEDRAFDEDFAFDFGFMVTMMESERYDQAEVAMVELVDIVRSRLEVVFDRPDDGEALGEAAAALVLMERVLTLWPRTSRSIDAKLNDALGFATASIDNFDRAIATVGTSPGRPLEPLRELVNIDGWGDPAQFPA